VHTGRLLILLSVSALAAGVCAVPVARDALLRGAGSILVAEDPLVSADVIVIANDADGAGVLEAADLVHAGIAPRVALFAQVPTRASEELSRRGIPHRDDVAAAVDELKELGITQILQVPAVVTGTTDEGERLPQLCARNGFHSVVFVSTTDHSRRTRRVLRRAVRGRSISVIERYSPYSQFSPDRWWQSREGVRTELVESEKLLLDLLRHPLG
jgi:hypothetical protein